MAKPIFGSLGVASDIDMADSIVLFTDSRERLEDETTDWLLFLMTRKLKYLVSDLKIFSFFPKRNAADIWVFSYKTASASSTPIFRVLSSRFSRNDFGL